MLKRIECDKFTQRIPNQEIVFHSGLNAVVGPDDGANSIGKSTFLQIVDFCFGGNTYGKGESDVIKNVGHHVIRFEFEFGGEVFRFARSTNDPTHIEQFEDSRSIRLSNIPERKIRSRHASITAQRYQPFLPHLRKR